MELRGTTDQHALLEGLNMPMLEMALFTALVAILVALLGTVLILRYYKGTSEEQKVRKVARIGWVGLILYLLVFLVYYEQKATPKAIPYPFAKGDAAIAKGDFKTAISAYQEVVRKYPAMAQAHFKLGMVYRMVKAIPKAKEELQMAIKEDPDKAEPYFALGSILWSQGTSIDALPYFQKGLSIDPTNPQKDFFMKIIKRAELEQKGLLKPGSEARPRLSPAAPDASAGGASPSSGGVVTP
jgi:tetratricopeptide (TPR) repeat protein